MLKTNIMAKMIISEVLSTDKNYALVEDGEVKVVLNEATKTKGYMPISEAKAFAHSIIDAMNKRDKLLSENGKHNT